jgi:hypothetical protein
MRVVFEAVFADIRNEHGGFDGEQTKLTNQCHLILVQVHAANRLALVEHGQ